MSRSTHVRRRESQDPSNVEYLKLVETTVNVDEQVLCYLREDIVNMVLSLPGVELNADDPHETLHSAKKALLAVINPEPVKTPEEIRGAKVAADVEAAMVDAKEFEWHRLMSWAEHYAAAEYGSEDDQKSRALHQSWSSHECRYIDPPDVPEGWPPNAADPEAYIRKEMEWRHRPPGNDDDLPPAPEEPIDKPVVETEMHKLLRAASEPAQPPAHD